MQPFIDTLPDEIRKILFESMFYIHICRKCNLYLSYKIVKLYYEYVYGMLCRVGKDFENF